MNKDLMIAYTEVDTIINLMEDKYKDKIPEKMRQLISKNKLNDYKIKINPNISLKEQKISRKALAILAVLNYNYWCENEYRKKELLELYSNNEKKYQDKLNEIYNVDKLFDCKNYKKEKNIDKESTQLVKYNKKDGILIRIINKIKIYLKLT